jgi:S1-C subfamily serine protease
MIFRAWSKARALPALLLIGLSVPAFAQQPRPAQISADAARAEIIARGSRSMVHVKGVEPPRPVADDLGLNSRNRREREAAEMWRRLIGQNNPLEPPRQEGSGFVWDAQRGLILTAAHLVERAQSVTVTLPDGSERPAEKVGVDPELGIAVLRVPRIDLPELSFAAHTPRAGEAALVLGWMIQLRSVLAMQGMVMGGIGNADLDASAAPPLADYVALDNTLPNGGFGGGPALDGEGKVFGVVSAIFGRGYGPDALTLVIPATQLRPVLEDLVTTGRVRRSQIGIATQCEQRLCTVTAVETGSPAERAGLAAGDRILTANGQAVQTSVGLRRVVAATPVGASVRVVIDREGRSSTIDIPTVHTSTSEGAAQ